MESRQSRTTIVLSVLLCSLFEQSLSNDQIPLEAFAKPPDIAQVILSPDGKHVAWLRRVSVGERLGTEISMANLEKKVGKVLGFGSVDKFVVNWITWAGNKHVLMSARFPEVRYGVPTTETRLISLNIETGVNGSVLGHGFLRSKRRVPQFQDQIVDLLDSDEDQILLAASFESAGASEVLRVNLNDGRTKRVVRDRPNTFDWVTDRQERVRIAVQRKETVYKIMHRAVDTKKWKTLWRFESFADDQVWPLGFAKDPDLLYVNAYHDGRKAIFKVDLRDPELQKELVFSHPTYDAAGGLIYSNVSGEVVGTRFSANGGFTFWDDDLSLLQQGVDAALPDTSNKIYSLSDDERKYVVLATSDTEPGTYYVGDRDKTSLDYIASRYADIDAKLLSEKRKVKYEARDGLQIEGYVTVPQGAANEPLPTIIFPHGGPISFDDGGFDYWTQFFASRGYAVLQMNFRGSSGYGYEFMKSGLKSWGLEMQNDVEDGTRWMIDNGIADPEKICVVGGSYGGYAALMEAARNPDLYNCAISFAGVTDVAYLVRSNRRYTNYQVVREQIGSDYSELRDRSPLHLSKQINIPVLLGHGTEDRSVRVTHSRRMHRALEKDGKSVTYLEFEDGDHYLSNEEHRIGFFRAMDTFLKTHLKK